MRMMVKFSGRETMNPPGTKISPRFLADLTYVFGVQTPDLDSIREPSKNKFNGVLRHLMYFASKNYFLYYIECIE